MEHELQIGDLIDTGSCIFTVIAIEPDDQGEYLYIMIPNISIYKKYVWKLSLTYGYIYKHINGIRTSGFNISYIREVKCADSESNYRVFATNDLSLN